jgi:hypothetical protein
MSAFPNVPVFPVSHPWSPALYLLQSYSVICASLCELLPFYVELTLSLIYYQCVLSTQYMQNTQLGNMKGIKEMLFRFLIFTW